MSRAEGKTQGSLAVGIIGAGRVGAVLGAAPLLDVLCRRARAGTGTGAPTGTGTGTRAREAPA